MLRRRWARGGCRAADLANPLGIRPIGSMAPDASVWPATPGPPKRARPAPGASPGDPVAPPQRTTPDARLARGVSLRDPAQPVARSERPGPGDRHAAIDRPG